MLKQEKKIQKGAITTTLEKAIDPAWYIDSGATNYLMNSFNNLKVSIECSGKEKLAVSNGQNLHISDVRYSKLLISYTKYLFSSHILFVLNMTKNILLILRC